MKQKNAGIDGATPGDKRGGDHHYHLKTKHTGEMTRIWDEMG